MSRKPFFPGLSRPVASPSDHTDDPVAPVTPEPAPPQPEVPPAPARSPQAAVNKETPQEPLRVMTERDSYIAERIASQPPLEEVKRDVQVLDEVPHRMALPEFFERLAYDCSLGERCPHHRWVFNEQMRPRRWEYARTGEFIFRWVKSQKRHLDEAINLDGWSIVNRSYFPNVPRHLFSANGAVEIGDALLMFMPTKKALALRELPGRRSRELLANRLTTTRSGEVIMQNREILDRDETYYAPDLSSEKGETAPDEASDVQVQV